MVNLEVTLVTSDDGPGFDGEASIVVTGADGTASEATVLTADTKAFSPGSTQTVTIRALDVGEVATATLKLVSNGGQGRGRGPGVPLLCLWCNVCYGPW